MAEVVDVGTHRQWQSNPHDCSPCSRNGHVISRCKRPIRVTSTEEHTSQAYSFGAPGRYSYWSMTGMVAFATLIAAGGVVAGGGIIATIVTTERTANATTPIATATFWLGVHFAVPPKLRPRCDMTPTKHCLTLTNCNCSVYNAFMESMELVWHVFPISSGCGAGEQTPRSGWEIPKSRSRTTSSANPPPAAYSNAPVSSCHT